MQASPINSAMAAHGALPLRPHLGVVPGATTLPAAAQSTPEPRLVRAAHEFEAQMMKELMRPLQQNSALTGDDEADGDASGSAGALGEFASEALGKALSEGGGFGLASSIVKQLSRRVNPHSSTSHPDISHPEVSHPGNQFAPGPVTGRLHADTVIKTRE